MMRKREKSKPHVMSNFADHAYYCYKKKLWEGERGEKRKEKKNFVVISSGTLFCRLQRKEPEKDSREKEASKWYQLID